MKDHLYELIIFKVKKKLFTWHTDVTRGYDMACDVNTSLMNVAQVIQLKANVKFDYPIEIFYNSDTQMGVTK